MAGPPHRQGGSTRRSPHGRLGSDGHPGVFANFNGEDMRELEPRANGLLNLGKVFNPNKVQVSSELFSWEKSRTSNQASLIRMEK